MADTIQVVQWALGQKCRLRQGADWQNPATALKTLGHFQTYSELSRLSGRETGVFGDVCVTSIEYCSAGKDDPWPYGMPSGGFIISSKFAPYGGLAALHQMCGECPANDNIGGLAGCCGYLIERCAWKELQDSLDCLIQRFNLKSKLDEIFPRAELYWYRFWIKSPIEFEGVSALYQIFGALLEEEKQARSRRRFSHLEEFVRILKRSLDSGIQLYVNLTPPGHTDFGWYTIFPHCPRCKLAAPVPRWKRKYADVEIVCAMCGERYSPAKTGSAVRDPDQEERDHLRDVLGQAEFEKLAIEWLKSRDVSEGEAMEVVQFREEVQRARQRKTEDEQEERRKNALFVKEVIFKGLKNLGSEGDHIRAWRFSTVEMEEVLRRCQHYGARIFYIMHEPESDYEDCTHETIPEGESAETKFQKLRSLGCNHKFSLNVRVPKKTVDRWLEQGNA